MASVTMTLDELRAIEQRVAARDLEILSLKQALAEERLTDPQDRVSQLTALARSMLEIVRFGVANMPPEQIKNWPISAIECVAAGLERLPDYSPDDGTLSRALLDFASDVREVEKERRALYTTRDANLQSDT